MKTMRDHFLSFFIAALMIVSSATGQTPQPDVRVLLRLDAERQHLAEGVVVSVTIENMGTKCAVVFPHFFPEGTNLKNIPLSHLTFHIRGTDGVIVDYSGAPVYPQYAVPQPSTFVVLAPSAFYGKRINLTQGDFRYHLQVGHTYYIKATLHIESRSWIENQLKKGSIRKDRMSFPLDALVNGKFESNEIKLIVE